MDLPASSTPRPPAEALRAAALLNERCAGPEARSRCVAALQYAPARLALRQRST